LRNVSACRVVTLARGRQTSTGSKMKLLPRCVEKSSTPTHARQLRFTMPTISPSSAPSPKPARADAAARGRASSAASSSPSAPSSA
jgi:hypothetical protein